METELQEYTDVLFNMAMLNSGFVIENPTEFTNPLQKLIKLGFGLRKDAPIEEIEIDISSLEEEEEGGSDEPEEEGEIEEETYRGDDEEENNHEKEDL